MRIFVFCIFMAMLAGCATMPEYDPLKSANSQVLLLNEAALKAVHEGMTIDQVHNAMGDAIIIGYTADPNSSQYKPLTISNPYKAQELSNSQSTYIVEYYVTSVRQPDGVISDDELMPFVFQNHVLIGRGWPMLNTLRSKPAA